MDMDVGMDMTGLMAETVTVVIERDLQVRTG